MKGTLTFLGTGSSAGIPVIGCLCDVCQSSSPYNKRLRSSVSIQYKGRHLLIDAGPDFRQQALLYRMPPIDGIIFTHAHYDHTSGIDDLRPVCYRLQKPLPFLLSEPTSIDILKRFEYLFYPPKNSVSFTPKLELTIFSNQSGWINFEGIDIQYVTYEQGNMPVNGFRIGNIAYLSDVGKYCPSIIEELKGVRYLIISALRYSSSPLHLSIDEAVEFSVLLGVEKTWLTHISHEIDHEKANAYLPPNVRVAYDHLQIEFEGDE